MGRSYRDNDFSDRDEQLNGDFFYDAEAISDVEDAVASELPLSVSGNEKEKPEDTEEIDTPRRLQREVGLSEAKEVFFREEPQIEFDEEFGSKRYDQDSPKWLKAFYECVGLARGFRRTEFSRIMLLCYERRGSAGVMVSSLPTKLDASIDVELCAARALSDSPALHKLFVDCYLDDAISEDSLSVEHRSTITERVGRKMIQRGIYPLGGYYTQRVSAEAIKREVEKMEAAEQRELRNEAQRKRRAALTERASLKQKRTITTLKAAA